MSFHDMKKKFNCASNTAFSEILFFSRGNLQIFNNCDALRDLLPFVQFMKLEKHPWTSVTFSKVAGFSLQLY